MTMCIKAFLLLLVGLTIFAYKNSKNVYLKWMTALQDLDTVREWSWGGMTLDFLYTQLSLATDPTVGAVGGYMTPLEVIYFFFLIIIDDLQYYCVCICVYDTCVDIIVSLCVCRDEFWSTSWSSFRGSLWRTTIVLKEESVPLRRTRSHSPHK